MVNDTASKFAAHSLLAHAEDTPISAAIGFTTGFGAEFNYTIFELPNQAIFGLQEDKDKGRRLSKFGDGSAFTEDDISEFNMSDVSFLNADITRVRFGDKVKWGTDERDWIWQKKEYFKVIEEEWLRNLASMKSVASN